MTDIEAKLEYVISHDPIRYVVKRKYFFWWAVEDLKGNLAGFYFWKESAILFSQLLNSIYSCGYAVGIKAVIDTIFENTES
jgi:hypothetical protein